jgi:division protein CdvB (Snf7/Vps24/ESCRT-III family)
MYRQAAAAPDEKEVTQAVRRVLDKYGSDLNAFFRHVQEVTQKNVGQQSGSEHPVNEKRGTKSAT